MGWFKKDETAKGIVLFRGSMAPRAEDFAFLQKHGIKVQKKSAPDTLLWALALRHETWGDAILFCPRTLSPPPSEWITMDARLSDAEKETALQGQSTICLHVEPKSGNVLRDRKSLLRYMRAVMGDDGVVAIDHASLRMWSKAALDDELCHDADLDIEALYTLHVVGDDAGERPIWLHTHGLAAIGHFDFDILEPSEDLFGGAADAIRAIAFAIAEGEVKPSTDSWQLTEPGDAVRFVEAVEFMKKADPRHTALRDDPGGDHVEKRSVLCEPVGKLGKLLGGSGKPAPSKFLSKPFAEEGVVNFSEAATKLSAERARQTYGMFRKLAAELAEFGFANIAKIGYDVDGATDGEREHLWFEVHAMSGDHLDATLQSAPFHIASMKEGQRGRHPAERLSDWAIITPAGIINPRNTAPVRMIRENREALLKMMREAQPS